MRRRAKMAKLLALTARRGSIFLTFAGRRRVPGSCREARPGNESPHKSLICDGTWNPICGGTFVARDRARPGEEFSNGEERMNPGKIATAATTFACATLLSLSWSVGSAQAVEKAQTRVSHAKVSKHVAVSHRHMRYARHGYARGYGRAPGYGPGPGYGYGPNPVAAGANVAPGAVNTAGAIAAGAIGTAGAIAAAPFGEGPYAMGPGYEGPYYASSNWGDYECRPGVGPYDCRPYAAKDWYHR